MTTCSIAGIVNVWGILKNRRAMADGLLTLNKARAISPQHESRWLNLAGFCLRPGFADASLGTFRIFDS
ncbi:MAG: hypothetical protein P8X96_15280 [Desulfobacteraceae bacterium]